MHGFEQLTDKDEQLTDKDEQLTDKDEQLTDKDEQLTDKEKYGFEQLTDKEKYSKILVDLYNDKPEKFSGVFNCQILLDVSEIEKSYAEYLAYVKYFSGTLKSANPDHYKRSGALLLALSSRNIVVDVDFTHINSADPHDPCSIPLGFSNGDIAHIFPYMRLLKDYPNQVMAFHICYKMMAQYEKNVKNLFYTFEYYEIVCALLDKDRKKGGHRVISPDSSFLLFKSLAQ